MVGCSAADVAGGAVGRQRLRGQVHRAALWRRGLPSSKGSVEETDGLVMVTGYAYDTVCSLH